MLAAAGVEPATSHLLKTNAVHTFAALTVDPRSSTMILMIALPLSYATVLFTLVTRVGFEPNLVCLKGR